MPCKKCRALIVEEIRALGIGPLILRDTTEVVNIIAHQIEEAGQQKPASHA